MAVATTSGEKEAYMFVAKDAFKNDYMVAYSRYSGKNPDKISAVKLFDNVRDGILLAQKGKLLSQTAITSGSYRGREIAVERPDGSTMTARFYLVENRFYQLTVETKTNERESEAIMRFLDSFSSCR